MVKLIIFDVGGVLLDFSEEEYSAYITHKLGINEKDFLKTLRALLKKAEVGRLPAKRMERILSSKFHVPVSKLEFRQSFWNLAKLDQNVISIATKLSKRYKVVLLTNVCFVRYRQMKRMLLDKLDFKVFASCYIRMAKPSARLYKYVLKKMHVKPNEAIFIDNLERNVEGARQVGIKSIRFESYDKLVKELIEDGVL